MGIFLSGCSLSMTICAKSRSNRLSGLSSTRLFKISLCILSYDSKELNAFTCSKVDVLSYILYKFGGLRVLLLSVLFCIVRSFGGTATSFSDASSESDEELLIFYKELY